MSSRTPIQTTNIKAEMKLLTMLAIALLISHEARATPSAADYQRCSLIYGALFKAARDVQHKGMIEYTQPRLGAVLPFLEANKDNPDAAASFKTVAQQTLPVVKALENNVKDALQKNDGTLLKRTLGPVISCDKSLGLQSFPLPVASTRPADGSTFAVGMFDGCVDLLRKPPAALSEHSIRVYCACQVDAALGAGVNVRSSRSDIDASFNSAHSVCGKANAVDSDSYQPPIRKTRIEATAPGARIIVDGEFVGITPLDVDLVGDVDQNQDLGSKLFNASRTRNIKITALPIEHGCAQVQFVSDQKLPKRMYFDTRMCVSQPSMDVYVK